MSVFDTRCDICAAPLARMGDRSGDPTAAIRLMLHPGDPKVRDDSVLVCTRCWGDLTTWLGAEGTPDACSACGAAVAYEDSLHMLRMTGRAGEAPLWQVCREHGVDLLNRFRFTQPKLEPGALSLKSDFPDA